MGHGSEDGRVGTRGMLSSAGVIGSTRVSADVVAIAVLHALVAPFLTLVEGDSLRVFGEVRGDVVGADAGVG